MRRLRGDQPILRVILVRPTTVGWQSRRYTGQVPIGIIGRRIATNDGVLVQPVGQIRCGHRTRTHLLLHLGPVAYGVVLIVHGPLQHVVPTIPNPYHLVTRIVTVRLRPNQRATRPCPRLGLRGPIAHFVQRVIKPRKRLG